MSVEYEYGLFEQDEDKDVLIGRPHLTEHSVIGARDYFVAEHPEFKFAIRQRPVGSWEPYDEDRTG